MQFQIKCSDLLSSVAIAERAISTNDQTPALTGLHLSANEDSVTLTANNLQIAVQTKAPCQVFEPGEHIVSGKLFCELVRKLPNEPVTIKWQDGQVLVSVDTMEFALNTIVDDEFPEYPNCQDRVMSLTDYELERLIRHSVFAASNDEHKPIFMGVLVEIANQGINFVATDSNRLSFVRAQTGQTHLDQGEYIVPKINLIELVRCLPMTETMVDVFYGDNQLAFRFEDTIFTTRLIDGRFPRYLSVLYTDQETAIIVKRQKLIQALERAALFGRADEAPVLIQVNEGILEVATTSRLGKSQEQCNVEQRGPQQQAAYAPKFLLDMLKTMSGDQVEFRFEGTRQALIKAEDSDDHLYVVMPMRI
ncbi:MAG: DNA polymerase III subunit beta [Limnochordia bacterium]|jgi:DNA polymerase-3 subunit beta|nr:DNA polymerase III subunit beta [Bacillota bacterium]NLL08477.1 DNA polymerase III subunit beta [Bacillota bacterium]HBG09570.1 DNA polymerase III subunit beta [Bacillota bacterium]